MRLVRLKFFIILSLIFTLSGCSSVHIRGQSISDKLLKSIDAQKPNKTELVHLIGTPTYIPDYIDNKWYYIQRSMKHRLWFDPKVIEQRIIEIHFQDDRVKNIKLLHNTNNNIAINTDYTKTHGTNKSAIQKFVKNLGRFGHKKSISNRARKER